MFDVSPNVRLRDLPETLDTERNLYSCPDGADNEVLCNQNTLRRAGGLLSELNQRRVSDGVPLHISIVDNVEEFDGKPEDGSYEIIKFSRAPVSDGELLDTLGQIRASSSLPRILVIPLKANSEDHEVENLNTSFARIPELKGLLETLDVEYVRFISSGRDRKEQVFSVADIDKPKAAPVYSPALKT